MSNFELRKIIKIFQKSLQKISSVLSSKYENFSIFEGGNTMKNSSKERTLQWINNQNKKGNISFEHRLQRPLGSGILA